jgi:hypothetical protein
MTDEPPKVETTAPAGCEPQEPCEEWRSTARGWIVVGTLGTLVIWLLAFCWDTMQQSFAHAGDAVAVVGSVAAAVAVLYAVRGVDYQRQALDDQRESSREQAAQQQSALAEQRRAQVAQLSKMQETIELQRAALEEQRYAMKAQMDAMKADHEHQRHANELRQQTLNAELETMRAGQRSQARTLELQQEALIEQRKLLLHDHKLQRAAVLRTKHAELYRMFVDLALALRKLSQRYSPPNNDKIRKDDVTSLLDQYSRIGQLIAELMILDDDSERLGAALDAQQATGQLLTPPWSDGKSTRLADVFNGLGAKVRVSLEQLATA